MINFVAFKSEPHMEGGRFNGAWVCPTEKSEFANIFRSWEPEAQILINVGSLTPYFVFCQGSD